MEPIEEQIREELILRKSEEIYQLTQKPKYLSAVKKSAKTMTISLLNAALEKDKCLNDVEMLELNLKLEEIFSNPKQLRLIAYQQARDWYMTSEQADAMLSTLYEEVGGC
jgi:hypothetical protein